MFARSGYEHGRVFHHAILILLSLLFFGSLILLIFSIRYGEFISSDQDFLFAKNGAQLIFYLGTLPVLALVHTLIQLLLSNRDTYLSPRAMVIISTIFIPAWIVVASIWTDCEIVQPNSNVTSLPRRCPQSILSTPTVGGYVFHRGLANTKDTFAWLLMICYVAYFVSATVAWWKEEKTVRDKERDKDIGFEMQTLHENQ